MSTYIIERAPGKELIPHIIDRQLYTDVVAFYTIRANWYRYPLINDGDLTYGLFDDLISQLGHESILTKKLLHYLLRIANEETDKRFLNALYFLHNLCALLYKKNHPSDIEVFAIKALHKRVQRLSFLPNIIFYWEYLLRYIENDASVHKEELMVDADDYKQHMDLHFPVAGDGTAASCPKNEEEIRAVIQHLSGVFFPLHFIQSATIENEKIWLWLYQNKNEDGISWYITIKETADGHIKLRKYLLLKGLEKTPERILLDCHYLERENPEG